MDLSDVQGKLFPQKVILDTSIETVTGEPVPAGTEICVLLCEQLVVCVDDGDYFNVNVGCSTKVTDRFKKIYLNPGNQEFFADIHCNGKTFKTFDELCRKRPRFFSCNDDFFAINENECMVRVKSGEKLEFKTIQANTNVKKTTKTSSIVLCNRNNINIQIPSPNKYTFQGLEDPNHYTTHELLEIFPLPRQVKMMDKSLYKFRLPYLCSKELNLQSFTTNCFLLFTLELKTSPPLSEFELRHQVKCCELVDPTAVKLRRHIDNSQSSETFSTIFLFEQIQDGQLVFSVIGRQCFTPIPRLNADREHSKDNDSGFADADLESCTSTLTVEKRSCSNNQHISHGNNTLPRQNERRPLRRLSTQEEYFNSIDDGDTTFDHASGEYVGVRVDREEVSPLPERTYLDPPIAQKDNQIKYNSYTASTEQVKAGERAYENPETINKELEKRSEIPSISQPESDLRFITMIQLGNLLKKFKLDKFAEKCFEEQIDGNFFMDMTDEILKEEPFSLNRFEILKVTKLQSGWNPK
ncbi:unnamed protein product [Mytilus coruscus]|uniref:CABIT domain-containing protein n=1 Tax=Mytilus coruscus TaxID=42192 RepID=A0A6J8AI32_MYTCO|nr:unnamed protein product [Mytilus coruscus]